MTLNELIESFEKQLIYCREQQSKQLKDYVDQYGKPPPPQPFDDFNIIEGLLLMCREIQALKNPFSAFNLEDPK